MSSTLPALLDPWRAVEHSSQFAGSLPLSGLPRLCELLLDSAGEVDYRLTFCRDEEHRAIVQGEARATLQLRCQRCLAALTHEVAGRVALALVRGMDEARQLPERYDPLLVTDESLRPIELIEDELLLGLPQIPMHDFGVCSATGPGSQPSEGDDRPDPGHPFAALADWKRER